jgi:hypothetical protein
MLNNAQGAIEYLLIIAAAILVVAIVILAVTGALFGGQEQTSQGIEFQESAVDDLKESSKIYSRINNRYYINSNPIGRVIEGVWHLDGTGEDAGSNKLDFNEGNAIVAPGLWSSSSYSFNGTSEWLGRVNTSLVEDKENFTISLWVFPTENSEGGLFAQGVSEVIFLLNQKSDGVIYVGMWNEFIPGNWKGMYTESNVIKINEWNNIVFSLDNGAVSSGKCKLYNNGVLILTDTINCQIVHHPAEQNYVVIGGAVGDVFPPFVQPENYFKGRIDEIAIWDKVLTDGEVKELWDNAQ